MHELYKLKDMLCKELEGYGTKELTAGTLDVVDKLTHTIKNLDKIIEVYEEDGEYSSRAYDDGMSRRGRSYARGRMNARRDSMGRYSRTGLSDELRELMQDAPNDHIRSEMSRLADKIETM